MRAAPEPNERVDQERRPADEHHEHQPVHDDDDLVDARRVSGRFNGEPEPAQHLDPKAGLKAGLYARELTVVVVHELTVVVVHELTAVVIRGLTAVVVRGLTAVVV